MDRLLTSVADIKCRAVVHEPGVATSGKSVNGALSTPFDRDLNEIRSLLLGAATFEVARPTIQTAATVAMTSRERRTRASHPVRSELIARLSQQRPAQMMDFHTPRGAPHLE